MAYPTTTPSYAGFTSTHTLQQDTHAAQHNQEQADIVALAGKVGLSATTPVQNAVLRGTGTGTSAWDQVHLATDVSGQLPAANASLILQAVYPVGCIYTETTGINPSTTFGFGTWAAYGSGRVLVGNGTSDQAFTAGGSGGESNHTLSTTEMPSHNHPLTDPGHTHNVLGGTTTGGSNPAQFVVESPGSATVGPTISNTTGITLANTGGGSSHNNLQPYIVVYFWQRNA